MSQKGTVMIVDDHPIVREGLEMLINMNPTLTVVASVADGEAAEAKLQSLSLVPDIIVVDLQLPKLNGVDLIKQIKKKTKILVLSTEINDEIVTHMADYGICGYLLKSEEPNTIVSELAKLIKDPKYVAVSDEVTARLISLTASNQRDSLIQLTDKQITLLEMVSQGKTNKEIAKSMFVTDRTIKLYLTEIYEILDVSNRAQAIAVAVKEGIIVP